LAIHGLPVSSEEEAWDYIERDWTDGCIAVTNEHMEEIWHMVDTGIPIEILP
jgi:murein L,D-transpeptidase YafK